MQPQLHWLPRFTFTECRELAWPKEHGSWSLAFEPLALGLLAARTAGGAWLAVAVTAAFFARRPLRIACRETNATRRALACRVLAVCFMLAAAAFVMAIAAAGIAWVAWLVPSAIAGGVFLSFDLRNDGRAEIAEVAGAAAFSFLPAAFAILGGWPAAGAAALAFVMLGRAVPTVLSVRAYLRGVKTGVWRTAPALFAASLALMVGVILVRTNHAPGAWVLLLVLLAIRAALLLEFPRPALRASTVGMGEAILGVGFVVAAGLTAG